jgi:hypothetical protein
MSTPATNKQHYRNQNQPIMSLVLYTAQKQGVLDRLPIFAPYHLDQCGWLANRYAEAIAAEPDIKQKLLSEPDPQKRMEAVAMLVE